MEELQQEDNFVDKDEGQRYDFDFKALSKLKRRERLKLFILSIIIVLLFILLLVVSVLYHKEHTKGKFVASSPTGDFKTAKTSAYKKIAKYGEDCQSTAKNHTQCGANAYCRYLQGTYRCDCKESFVGDGIGDCQDVGFAISFRVRTTKNIPEIRRVHFPQTDELSVCLWFKLAELSNKWSAIFLYTSVEIAGSNELILWFNDRNEVYASMRDKDQLVLKRKLHLHVWTHLCWTWESTGRWSIYINGRKANKGYDTSKKEFIGAFPDSQGSVILGQDKDHDKINQAEQMFRGQITQFYIYHERLTDEEIYSAFQNHPSTQNIVAGWWQFKNKTNGTEIVESKFPWDLFP